MFNHNLNMRVFAKVTQPYAVEPVKSYMDMSRKFGIFPLFADELDKSLLVRACQSKISDELVHTIEHKTNLKGAEYESHVFTIGTMRIKQDDNNKGKNNVPKKPIK